MPLRTHAVRLPLVLAAAACNEIEISSVDVVDAFRQSPWEKVDVLLVVDDSCSMAPYQQKLGTDFGSFFDYFAEGDVDWRLAVTKTGARNADFGSIRGPIIGPDAGDPEALFAEVVNVGIGGSGIEAGLAAAAHVLKNQRDGFPRDDASLSVIFVSDEEDASPESVATYVDGYFELRGQRQRAAFNASALTVTERADCSPEQFAASSRGSRYEKVAQLTGGLTANLCVDDFEGIVHDLALTTSTLLDTFYLRLEPDPLSIVVQVDAVEVPCTDGAWTYAHVERDGREVPAIVFAADQLPAPGADVVVEYVRGSGDPADFCVVTP